MVLGRVGFQAPFADHDAVGNSQQFDVCKLDSRALVAVVQQCFDPLILQGCIQAVAGFANGVRLLVSNWNDGNHKGGDGRRPDNAPVIMVLLNGRGDHPRHADSIAAHLQHLAGAVRTLYLRIHRFAVNGSQLEDVTDFDATTNLDVALAIGAWVSSLDVANVFYAKNAAVAFPAQVLVVETVFVGTGNEGAQGSGAAVDNHWECDAAWPK